MAITAPIPIPETGMDALMGSAANSQSIIDSLMKNQLIPYQAAEMQGKAAQSQMIANLINSVVNGGAVGATGSGGGATGATGGGGINKGALLAGILGIPTQTQVVDGNLVQTNPFSGTSIQKVGESPQEKSQREARQAASSKTMESTAESALGGMGVNASFDALDQMMQDPNYSKIAGTVEGKAINAQPFGIPVGSWLQSAFPGRFTPEEASLAGQAQAHMGNIISGVAAKFKGPFKAMVSGIINNMKPNMGDSIAVQRGKITALKQLSDLADRQNAQIAEYVDQGMNPTAAILRVAKEMPISTGFQSSQGATAQRTAQNNAPAGTSQSNFGEGSTLPIVADKNGKPVIVLYKGGKEYRIPADVAMKNMDALRREGFGLGD